MLNGRRRPSAPQTALQPRTSNENTARPVESPPLTDGTSETTPKRARSMRRLRKGLLFASSGLLLLMVLTYALRAPLLRIPARFLVIDQDPQTADIIVVLNTDRIERATRAAQLYQRGWASQIVIARAEKSSAEELGLAPNATELAVEVMTSSGVPTDSITIIRFGSGVTSTRDEAVAVRRYVEENDIDSVILVTTGFHTRRARWIFRKQLSEASVQLYVAAAPHPGYDESNWWKSEKGLINLNNEFIKLFYYMIKY